MLGLKLNHVSKRDPWTPRNLNNSETWINIHEFSVGKMHLKCRPTCSVSNVLRRHPSFTNRVSDIPWLVHTLLILGKIKHYNDVIMGAVASQITSVTIVYSTVNSDTDQRKGQSSASLAFVRGIHRGPVSSTHKWPVTRKMFPFDDVIMSSV